MAHSVEFFWQWQMKTIYSKFHCFAVVTMCEFKSFTRCQIKYYDVHVTKLYGFLP